MLYKLVLSFTADDHVTVFITFLSLILSIVVAHNILDLAFSVILCLNAAQMLDCFTLCYSGNTLFNHVFRIPIIIQAVFVCVYDYVNNSYAST